MNTMASKISHDRDIHISIWLMKKEKSHIKSVFENEHAFYKNRSAVNASFHINSTIQLLQLCMTRALFIQNVQILYTTLQSFHMYVHTYVPVQISFQTIHVIFPNFLFIVLSHQNIVQNEARSVYWSTRKCFKWSV